ncbi:MAG: N-6 DNA methylase [Patescibacteria group bacterium]
MNERKTEKLIRNKLTNFGYFADKYLIIEEQKSDSEIINKLLSKASKSGSGIGYPEFIIRKNDSDVIIVIECKAHIKNHISKKVDSPKDFAVDGALHYASFLKNEFHVIAIAISGEQENNYKLSMYQWNKNEKRYFPKRYSDLMPYNDYYYLFHEKDSVVVSEKDLMQYAKKLHDEMRDEAKLKEAEKPLLVGALLLALESGEFVNEYPSITNPKKLANRIIESIEDGLKDANIPINKIDTLKREFGFIITHTYLTRGEIDTKNPSYDNNILHKFLFDIHKKVYPYIKKVNNMDIIGRFYSEFLKYTGGDGKGLGIVLTPTHITDLFCELAEVNKNSKVIDICTGTSGFLISAMEHMLSGDPTVSEIDNIYKNNLVGIETQTNMFALACANMIIRGDGKTNLLQDNCFDIKKEDLRKYQCNIGLINPPYSQKKEEEKELGFVDYMLDILNVGGIGVAILPVRCTNNDNDIRERIMKKHTLKAVMIMPSDLFKGVGTHTCIMVFEAHKPHSNKAQTWFALWNNDGFVNYKNQRVDRNNKWVKIKEKWLFDFRNKKEIDGYSVLKNVEPRGEWSALAYVKTNYKNLTSRDFKNTIKDHIICGIKKETGIENIYEIISTILDNKEKKKIFEKEPNDEKNIDIKTWKQIEIHKIFNVIGSKTTPKKKLEEIGQGEYPYVTTRAKNNGIDSYYNFYTDKGNVLTIDSATIGYCSYQKKDFTASDHVEKLIPKFKMTDNIAIFLQTLLNKEQFRYSYGRKFNQTRIENTKILMPFKNNEPDWKFMDQYIKNILGNNII